MRPVKVKTPILIAVCIAVLWRVRIKTPIFIAESSDLYREKITHVPCHAALESKGHLYLQPCTAAIGNMEHIKFCLHLRPGILSSLRGEWALLLRTNSFCLSSLWYTSRCCNALFLLSCCFCWCWCWWWWWWWYFVACMFVHIQCCQPVLSSTCSLRNALLIRIWISSTTGTSCTLLVTLTAVSRS